MSPVVVYTRQPDTGAALALGLSRLGRRPVGCRSVSEVVVACRREEARLVLLGPSFSEDEARSLRAGLADDVRVVRLVDLGVLPAPEALALLSEHDRLWVPPRLRELRKLLSGVGEAA
jgi:hypothetical protein